MILWLLATRASRGLGFKGFTKGLGFRVQDLVFLDSAFRSLGLNLKSVGPPFVGFRAFCPLASWNDLAYLEPES